MEKTLALLIICSLFTASCSSKETLLCESETDISVFNTKASKVIISVYKNGNNWEIEGMGISYKGNPNIECPDDHKAGLVACRIGRQVFLNIGNYPFETSQSFVISDETNVFSYGNVIKAPGVFISENAKGICR